MVCDPEQVTGELRFWITVAASKEVRVEPLADGSLVEPSEGVAGEGDSDEESDNDYEDARAALLVEPQYPEHAWGGFCVKGEARERRTTRQIIAACAKAGVKYEDPEFACDESMLSRDAGSALRALDSVAFLRPCWRGTNEADKHLVCAPELLLTGNSIGAIRQGQLADGWLLGAVAAVATQPKLLNHLLVDWSEEWGVFTFRVFKDGKWRHVTVDDRLPAKKDSRTCLFAVGVDAVTLEGQQGKRAERVMWVALFEKAYAKAHGCYAQLAKGAVPYALKDLTAGAPQACCMCLPYTSALCVCLLRLPYAPAW